MNDHQENLRTEFNCIVGVFGKYVSDWSGNVPLSACYGELTAELGVIEAYRLIAIKNVKGEAISKSKAKRELAMYASMIAETLQAFAADTRDSVLYNGMHITFSDLYYCRDTITLDYARIILGSANVHSADILAYGVTALMITELGSLISAYEGTIPKPREAYIPKKEANRSVSLSIRRILTLLDTRMDKMMAVYRVTAPDFYKEYFDARMVIDLSKRMISLKVIVHDALTGVPIQGADVELVETGKMEKTSATGRVGFKSLASGNYSVVVGKDGYVSQSIQNIGIVNGELVLRAVKLMKTGTTQSFGVPIITTVGGGLTVTPALGNLNNVGLLRLRNLAAAGQVKFSFSGVQNVQNDVDYDILEPQQEIVKVVPRVGGVVSVYLVLTNLLTTASVSLSIQKGEEVVF